MYTYRIPALYFLSNVSWWKVFFVKLHGAEVKSYGRVCLKNCHDTLDEEWRLMILYVHQISMYIRYVPRNELARWGLVRSMATVVGGQAGVDV
jgi:hypothetical protein